MEVHLDLVLVVHSDPLPRIGLNVRDPQLGELTVRYSATDYTALLRSQ